MPASKSNKVLPGTDPMFHEVRKYMTPVIYKGKEILGYIASCKHSGCRWTATYAGNEARRAGMFKHRSEKVLEARTDFFARTLTKPEQIEDAILDTADKHSHTLSDWVEAVGTLWGHYTDRSLEKMPEWSPEVSYHRGVSAREAARKMIAEEENA